MRDRTTTETTWLRRSDASGAMTVVAMRAAVMAIRSGVFDAVDAGDGAMTSSELRSRSGRARPAGGCMPWQRDHAGRPTALILAGHAGAGASTVALAVAEALTDNGHVQLVEYATPRRSGLAAASSIELGAEGAWWRRGRRGHLDIFRLAHQPADGQLPSPPELDGEGRLLVIDAGWSLTTALLSRCSGDASMQDEQVVVVTRTTVPAVRQTEHVLAAVGEAAVVAAVGSARWPRAVEASCGPRFAALGSHGRVVRVPVDRRLETSGLTGDRLPKGIAAAGRALARILIPEAPTQPRHRRRAASPRTGPAGKGR